MDFSVSIPEFEIRIFVVKPPDQPGIGIVAFAAILSQTLLVQIVVAVTVDTEVAGITKNGRYMARFTADHGMLTDECEIAQVVIETNFVLPGNIIVTLIAAGALVTLVHIILLMAAVTVYFDFFGLGAKRMTCLAYQTFMCAFEREFSVCAVIKFDIPPTSGNMAILALFAVQLVMYIIGAMTAVTVTRIVVMLFRNLVIVRMAIIAGLPPMLSLELVSGILIMIENRLVPRLLPVAGFTLLAKPADMNIPYRVAIYTLFRRVLVLPCDVTGIARHLLVCKFQFKVRLSMVKPGLSPTSGFVAILALLSQVTLMNIILGVTFVTGLFRFTIFLVLQVTGSAFH